MRLGVLWSLPSSSRLEQSSPIPEMGLSAFSLECSAESEVTTAQGRLAISSRDAGRGSRLVPWGDDRRMRVELIEVPLHPGPFTGTIGTFVTCPVPAVTLRFAAYSLAPLSRNKTERSLNAGAAVGSG